MPTLFEKWGVKNVNNGIISAHGDKCYLYRDRWEKNGIEFHKGVALYLLTYISPFSKESRETADGWVDPAKWVEDNYERFFGAIS